MTCHPAELSHKAGPGNAVWEKSKANDGIKRAIRVRKRSKTPHIEPAAASISQRLEPCSAGRIAPHYGYSISGIYQGRRYLGMASPDVQH
jgi:hypothetical protein